MCPLRFLNSDFETSRIKEHLLLVIRNSRRPEKTVFKSDPQENEIDSRTENRGLPYKLSSLDLSQRIERSLTVRRATDRPLSWFPCS